MSEWFGVIVAPPVIEEPVKRMADDLPVPRRRAAGRVWAAGPRRPGPVPSITVRRAEVLDLLVTGKTNAEIAKALGLSEPTVKNHVALSLRVMGARNRVQAAVQWVLKRQA